MFSEAHNSFQTQESLATVSLNILLPYVPSQAIMEQKNLLGPC